MALFPPAMEPHSEHTYELLPCPLPPSRIHLADGLQDVHTNPRESLDALQQRDTDHASSGQLISPLEINEVPSTHAIATNCDERDEHSSPKSELDQTQSAVHWNGLPCSRLFGDIMAIALSICFHGPSITIRCPESTASLSLRHGIALGVCICFLQEQEESEWSKAVIVVTELAPSFWPVIFSGVIGNALKAYANWHLERGVSLRVISPSTVNYVPILTTI